MPKTHLGLRVKLIDLVTKTKLWRWLLLKVMPYVRFSTYYTDFTGDKFFKVQSVIKKGDFVLALDKRKATAFVVPGEWTHAVQVLNPPMTAEMDHHGLDIRTTFDVCKEADEICVLRCKDYDSLHIDKIIEKIYEWRNENIEYDVTFSLGVKSLYCSELIYQADLVSGGKLKVDLSDIHGLGTQYISPDGLFSGENIEVVYDSRGITNARD